MPRPGHDNHNSVRDPSVPSIDYGRGTGNVCPEGTDLTIRTTNSAGQLTDAAFSFLAQ